MPHSYTEDQFVELPMRKFLKTMAHNYAPLLAADLQRDFPGQQGFSPRNLKYMRAFAEAWPPAKAPVKARGYVAQPKPEGAHSSLSRIVQASLAQLSWYHPITLLGKI